MFIQVKEVELTNEALRKIYQATGVKFDRSRFERLSDGNWKVHMSSTSHARLIKVSKLGETLSDTIVRLCRERQAVNRCRSVPRR